MIRFTFLSFKRVLFVCLLISSASLKANDEFKSTYGFDPDEGVLLTFSCYKDRRPVLDTFDETEYTVSNNKIKISEYLLKPDGSRSNGFSLTYDLAEPVFGADYQYFHELFLRMMFWTGLNDDKSSRHTTIKLDKYGTVIRNGATMSYKYKVPQLLYSELEKYDAGNCSRSGGQLYEYFTALPTRESALKTISLHIEREAELFVKPLVCSDFTKLL